MTTHIGLQFLERNPHKVEVTSLITALPALCPNLQNIQLEGLPRDPVITAAVSELLLSISRNTFRTFSVDSPLTEEDREVIYKLPDLRKLSIVLDSPTPLPTIILQKLLPLTQLKELVIGFSCEPSCSSTIDDDYRLGTSHAQLGGPSHRQRTMQDPRWYHGQGAFCPRSLFLPSK